MVDPRSIDFLCAKCGHDKAYVEYRRGLHGDYMMGEHLRHYCAVCRFMTVTPTKDQDTPERRAQLAAAFEQRREEWKGDRSFGGAPRDPRPSDIERVRREELNGNFRRRG